MFSFLMQDVSCPTVFKILHFGLCFLNDTLLLEVYTKEFIQSKATLMIF